MNKLALAKLNLLYRFIRRMKPSLKKNEPGITQREKKIIMEQLNEIAKTIRRTSSV